MGSYQPQHRSQRSGGPPRRQAGALVVGVLITLLVCGGVAFAIARSADDPSVAAADTSSTTTTTAATTSSSTTTTLPPPRSGTIAFGGDVLIHSGVWKAADTGAGYDFSPMLAPIQPQVSTADVAVCHLEVTLARPGDPLSSYPRFRAPRGWRGPRRGRVRRLLGGVEPRARLRRAGRGGDARRTRRGRSGARRHGESPEEDATPPLRRGRHRRRPALVRLRVQRLRAARQGVARRPDRPRADPGRRAGGPGRGRGARRRLAALGQRIPPRGGRGAAGGGRRARGRAGRGRSRRRAPAHVVQPISKVGDHLGRVGHGQPAVEQLAALLPG